MSNLGLQYVTMWVVPIEVINETRLIFKNISLLIELVSGIDT